MFHVITPGYLDVANITKHFYSLNTICNRVGNLEERQPFRAVQKVNPFSEMNVQKHMVRIFLI